RDSKLVFSYLKKTNHQCLRWNCDGGIFCIKIDAPWWHFQTVRRPEIAWRQEKSGGLKYQLWDPPIKPCLNRQAYLGYFKSWRGYN
ncbi:hypothetical protein LINPERHAP1_LOCUS12535, partial [Linum perenne]